MMTKRQVGKDEQRERQLIRRAALMVAEGTKGEKEIARELTISVGTLQVLRRSPLFNELVDYFSDEIAERGVQTVVDEIVDDAPRNINFIKNVRDGRFNDKKDRMDSRLRAAKMLLDKQVPNADAKVAEDVAKIVIQGKLLGQMLRSLARDGAIDVTPEEIEEYTGTGTIPIRTPEEVRARHEAEEDQAQATGATEPEHPDAPHPDDRL